MEQRYATNPDQVPGMGTDELRERFQLELEKCVRESRGGAEEAARYDRALRELDRAFLGTIHSFCARLLRERPLEVGLDPNFQEVSEQAWGELKATFCLLRTGTAVLSQHQGDLEDAVTFEQFKRI